MKTLQLLISILSATILTACATTPNQPTVPPESVYGEAPLTMNGHQQKMYGQIKKMNSLMSEMSSAESMQDKMKLSKAHSNELLIAVDMLKDMQAYNVHSNLECIEKATADDETCAQPETHEDTKMSMLISIVEQMLLKHQQMHQMMHHNPIHSPK